MAVIKNILRLNVSSKNTRALVNEPLLLGITGTVTIVTVTLHLKILLFSNNDISSAANSRE
jgi:hypothetical protein